jgi:hypothetical protein
MKSFFLLLSFLFVFFLNAEIVEIKNIKDIQSFLKENALVVLDLDNTLIETVQTLGSDQWFYDRISVYQNKGLESKEAFEKTYSEWFDIQCITKVKLVEKDTSNLIKNLQKKYKVIGLTTRTPDLNFTTFKQLKSVDIDLSKAAVAAKDFFFEDIRYCWFKNGILFGNGTDKGKALFKLLDKLNYLPKIIVFVDDKKKNLEEVEKVCGERNIYFVGLRYGFLDEKIKKFDRVVAEKQQAYFGKIFSDEEIKKIKN